MRIVTVVGARPQFIKAAPVSRALRRAHTEILVHTGQHYDHDMSGSFFDELGIPAPDHFLSVGSASHGAQTGRMLEKIEDVLVAESPDAVVVYGDTNSTLAGALAAAKLHIPIVHVEAGLRSFDMRMPEELNRVLTDRISALLLCPSLVASTHLANEGITEGVHIVGDVMLDALLDARERYDARPLLERLSVEAGGYALATIHRAENTDDAGRLGEIVSAFGELAQTIVLPLHPRTRGVLKAMGLQLPANVHAVNPFSYLELVGALSNAAFALTDSGGLQKEAYWLHVPCITLRDTTEWTETVSSGWNQIAGANRHAIIDAVSRVSHPDSATDAYGAQGASMRVVHAIDLLR
jgi:UDP-GlcNAc3NAcA epimerase